MGNIGDDLKLADLKGIAPPQNWTIRALKEITRLTMQNEELLAVCKSAKAIIASVPGESTALEILNDAIVRAGEK